MRFMEGKERKGKEGGSLREKLTDS